MSAASSSRPVRDEWLTLAMNFPNPRITRQYRTQRAFDPNARRLPTTAPNPARIGIDQETACPIC